jgi:ABC-type lipoprotein release transport system permease subunit
MTLVIGILISSGFLANWLPARRACAIDPMESLRAD